MDISIYYSKAKNIGELAKHESSSILDALNYNDEGEPPSSWQPKVQASLLQFFRDFPGSDLANDALELYLEGELNAIRMGRNEAMRIRVVCIVLGMFIGWLVWG